MKAVLLAMAALAAAGCARKNLPLPPEGAEPLTPRLVAPSVVTDPLAASED